MQLIGKAKLVDTEAAEAGYSIDSVHGYISARQQAGTRPASTARNHKSHRTIKPARNVVKCIARLDHWLIDERHASARVAWRVRKDQCCRRAGGDIERGA